MRVALLDGSMSKLFTTRRTTCTPRHEGKFLKILIYTSSYALYAKLGSYVMTGLAMQVQRKACNTIKAVTPSSFGREWWFLLQHTNWINSNRLHCTSLQPGSGELLEAPVDLSHTGISHNA